MNVDRITFTDTLLRDGRVLVVGGFSSNGSGVQASAELFDPATGRWTSTGGLRTPRRNHTATLLPDGTVLVAGGSNADGWLRSAEPYEPASGRWKRVAPMTTARGGGTATLLGNGRRRVLVAGGGNPSALRSAELYDPALGRWSTTGSMSGYSGAAALLRDGRVLVAGPSCRTWRPRNQEDVRPYTDRT
jgi:hypothetical protein